MRMSESYLREFLNGVIGLLQCKNCTHEHIYHEDEKECKKCDCKEFEK